MPNKDLFETQPIGKATLSLVIPSIFGMLITIIYNIADTLFIGWTNDASQVAAVSISMPVFLLLMAFGNIFGTGGASLISRLLGVKKLKSVKVASSFSFIGCIVIGLLSTILFLGFMPQILSMIGASPSTEVYAREYLSYIAYGAVFVVLAQAFSNLIRSEGAVKIAVKGMVIGTVINIILDPIMILGMNMGVVGAAIATIIGNVCTCFYYFRYLQKKTSVISISPKDFHWDSKIISGIFSIGIPASITNILMSASNMVLNYFLSSYGDGPLAAMGIAMKATMLLVLVQVGIGAGIQPLVGYNYGAKNYTRMEGFLRYANILCLVIGSTLTLIYGVFAPQIVQAFISTPEIITLGTQYIRTLIFSGPVVGIVLVNQFALQSMGKPLSALLLAVGRQGFIFMPVVVIGNYLAGQSGLVWAQPVADIICMFLSLGIIFYLIKKEKITIFLLKKIIIISPMKLVSFSKVP